MRTGAHSGNLPTPFGTAALTVLALVSLLAVWLAAGLVVDTSPLAPVATPAAGPDQAALRAATAPSPAPPPLAAFRGTLERPPFAPSRRPPPPEMPPVAKRTEPPPASPPDGLRIIGFMSASGGAKARVLMRAADRGEAEWLETGATIGEWRVASIGDGTVTLERGGRTHVLRIFQPAAGGAAAPEPRE